MFLEERQQSFHFLLYSLLRGTHRTPDKRRQSLPSAQAKFKNFLREGHARGNKFLVAADVDSKPEMLGTIVEQPRTLFSGIARTEIKILHAKLEKSN
jgi:hypothetical protein